MDSMTLKLGQVQLMVGRDKAENLRRACVLIRRAAEQGAQLVNDTGTTMEAILRDVTEVTVIMKQIATASEEQSKGISQVGVAITQMDGVTQQNASLVEQVSAAAAALERQTEELQRSVQKFRLTA